MDAVMAHKSQRPAVGHTCTAAVSEVNGAAVQIEGQNPPPPICLNQLLMRPKDTQAHTLTHGHASTFHRFAATSSSPVSPVMSAGWSDSGSTGAI